MHLMTFVSLLAYCLCTAQDQSGSGMVMQNTIEITFMSGQVNCTEFIDFLTDLLDDSQYRVEVYGGNCGQGKSRRSADMTYTISVINSTTGEHSAEKTDVLRELMCLNKYEIVEKFDLFVLDIDGDSCEQSFSMSMSFSFASSASSTTVLSTQALPSSSIAAATSQGSSSSTPSTEPTSSSEPESSIFDDLVVIVPTAAFTQSSSSVHVSLSSTTELSTQAPPSSSIAAATSQGSSSSTPSTEPTSSSETSSIFDDLVVIVSAAGSIVLVILLAVTVCLICMLVQTKKVRKRSKDKQRTLWEDTKPSMGGIELKSEVARPLRPSRVSFVSKGNLLLQTLSQPLSVEELGAILQATDRLHDEYMSIPPNMTSVHEIPVGAEDKNRYHDVLPNPNTRVPLFLKFGVAHSDYINANYIRGYKNQGKTYIASQGPMQHTVIDFWRMVWEQKVSVIIMTTGLIEKNIEKCFQYWPDQQGYGATDVYGDIQVVIRKKKIKGFYTVTTFSVQHLQRHVTREIFHYWYTGWPDHGVPGSPEQVVDFLLDTRSNREGFTMPGPTLVHCSAGIGRTGVFIAADIGMRQLEENMTVDVLKTVATLRQDRGGMVQVKHQYVFLHQVLYEYARRVGHVSNTGGFDETEDADEVDRDYEFGYIGSNTFK